MLLAQNPAAEAELTAELQTALACRDTVSPDDAPRLVFTEKVIKEAMRLYPPAWAIGRQAIERVKVGGHDVAAGESVIMPIHTIHWDGRFFDDPARFRPERWTPEFLRTLPRFAYFPFGGGPRVCIGSTFAMMESVLLLASIASRYRLAFEPGFAIVVQPSFTLRPKHGLMMQATPR